MQTERPRTNMYLRRRVAFNESSTDDLRSGGTACSKQQKWGSTARDAIIKIISQTDSAADKSESQTKYNHAQNSTGIVQEFMSSLFSDN